MNAGGEAAAARGGMSWGARGLWPDALARLARGREGEPWRIVMTTFVTLGLTYGFWYAYSVFLVAFIRQFGWSRSVVAGAFSMLVLVHGLSGPLIGWLVERFRPRVVIAVGGGVLASALLLGAQIGAVWQLYVVFGVLAALGMSAAGWVPSVVLIRAWFPVRVGTALGVASAGIGVGIFALVPFTQLLIDGLGWRWALRALALLIAAWIIPVALLMVRSPASGPPAGQPARGAGAAASPPARRHWTVRTAVRSWRFWGTSAVFFAGSAATQMPLVHQVAYLVDHGAPALVGATV